MMVKHVWTVLCKKSVIDNESNNLSLFELLEKLSLEVKSEKKQGQINVNFPFEIVSLWAKPAGETFTGKIKSMVISSTGKQIGQTIENDLIIPENVRRVRTRLKVEGFTIDEPGEYLFNIYLVDGEKEKKTASVPLEIDLKIT